MKRLPALAVAIGLAMLACGTQPPIALTSAYEANLATALAGTLAVVAPPTIAPSETAIPSPPSATLVPKYEPGTIPLSLGQGTGSLPRQATESYGFPGTEGEVVAVSFTLSLGSNHPFCIGRAKDLSYRLRAENGDTLDAATLHQAGSLTRTLTLPYTGVYYVDMTCAGRGCDGYCVEMGLVVNQK